MLLACVNHVKIGVQLCGKGCTGLANALPGPALPNVRRSLSPGTPVRFCFCAAVEKIEHKRKRDVNKEKLNKTRKSAPPDLPIQLKLSDSLLNERGILYSSVTCFQEYIVTYMFKNTVLHVRAGVKH